MGSGLLRPKRATTATPRPQFEALERLAWLTDRAFRIPGTRFRVGLDPILGLIPFGGDALMGLIQAGVVVVALTRYKVPRAVAARMIFNVLLDMGVGAIPIFGDLFDAAFKANTRNLNLLRQANEASQRGEPMASAPSRRYLIMLALGFLAVVALFVSALMVLFGWALAVLLGRTP
jgi:hypothetical protein